ncbi:Gibberellin-regulated protein 11 [Striga hermonthica]|uniref:Gibberellin-regulated protein 11 n=1 Tax=Striga hermonthica TaxID=68872 RepID=A0A9N7RE87_STRHE|nr:Gibberellin-regulated protein 11 [Striga hermonthica]
MAISKVLIIASLVLCLLVVNGVQAIQTNIEATSKVSYKPGPTIDCGASCKVRCSLSSRPNLCKRACGTCCSRCSCVPPGTSGNYETCPCYAKLTTRGNKRKCP